MKMDRDTRISEVNLNNFPGVEDCSLKRTRTLCKSLHEISAKYLNNLWSNFLRRKFSQSVTFCLLCMDGCHRVELHFLGCKFKATIRTLYFIFIGKVVIVNSNYVNNKKYRTKPTNQHKY